MSMTRPKASQVTAKLAATGSVVRGLDDKLAEFVSVKDFGAVGDGVADDTVAIQAALNAGFAFFPPGNYLVSAKLTSLYGAHGHYGQSTITMTGTADLLDVTGEECLVTGLEFVGQNTAHYGIVVKGKRCQIRQNRLKNFGSSGSFHGAIVASGAEGVIIDGNYISDGLGVTAADIAIGNNSVDIQITNNVCTSLNSEGITANGVDSTANLPIKIIITGNICRDKVRHGILAGYIGSADKRPICVVANNVCFNCGWMGIYTQNNSLASIGEYTIANNVVSNCGGGESAALNAGIYVSGDLGHIVTGNLILRSGLDSSGTPRAFAANVNAVAFRSSSKNIVISSNCIVGSTGGGVLINSGNIEGFVISDNRIEGCTLNPILMQPVAGQVFGNGAVFGNTITSEHAGPAIYLESTSTGTYNGVSVTGNTVESKTAPAGSYGIRLRQTTASGVAVTNNIIRGFAIGIGMGTVNNGSRVDGNRIVGCTTAIEVTSTQHLQIGKKGSINWNLIQDCTNGISIPSSSGVGWSVVIGNSMDNVTTQLVGARTIHGLTCAPVVEAIHSGLPGDNAWSVGDRIRRNPPAVGQPKAWVCTVAGSPGTWVSEGNL